MIDEWEKKKYFDFCKRKIKKITRDAKGREIYLWGAGTGGELALEFFKKNNIRISGFVDKNAKEKIYKYQELIVLPLKKIVRENSYIIVDLIASKPEIIDELYQNGFTECDFCYIYEMVNHEDIVYRGCRIGRYTYGYESLLEHYPIANIGRYCSINGTARIWNNHSLDCISTHPFLDYPGMYSWDKYKERTKLVKKYGKHHHNAKFENSEIRDNRVITIGNDVWIGANVVILPGIKIGDGAVLAAGAVVTKNVEPYSIVGGIPARRIRYRFSKEIINALLNIKWWKWSKDKIENNIELFYQPEVFIKKMK